MLCGCLWVDSNNLCHANNIRVWFSCTVKYQWISENPDVVCSIKGIVQHLGNMKKLIKADVWKDHTSDNPPGSHFAQLWTSPACKPHACGISTGYRTPTCGLLTWIKIVHQVHKPKKHQDLFWTMSHRNNFSRLWNCFPTFHLHGLKNHHTKRNSCLQLWCCINRFTDADLTLV